MFAGPNLNSLSVDLLSSALLNSTPVLNEQTSNAGECCPTDLEIKVFQASISTLSDAFSTIEIANMPSSSHASAVIPLNNLNKPAKAKTQTIAFKSFSGLRSSDQDQPQPSLFTPNGLQSRLASSFPFTVSEAIRARVPSRQVEQAPNRTAYDQQIILNLGSGRSGHGLNAKAGKHGLPSQMIDLRKKEELSALSKLTPSSRLYLIGHYEPGNDYIETSDKGDKVTVDEYVKMLIDYAPELQKGTPERHIKISLVACSGAVDSGEQKSFGFRLSQALDAAGIHATVIARVDEVSRWGGKPEDYKKFVKGRYKADGDKVIFTTISGKTSSLPYFYPKAN
ncbi:C80 family cysteine peptidase [Candidatus Protochlamydia phocaeensis]|uniref:C80 family cysteine peptidase n=1 Tax=Candidatus Protochlamydia phocaeensis TaxID=1414722 RepID=UPI0008384FBC|nr:C80 family cysteine peptidase [Candidatus Protochlamydia phocaeensis]